MTWPAAGNPGEDKPAITPDTNHGQDRRHNRSERNHTQEMPMNVETANRISAALRIHDEHEALHAAAQQLVKIVEGVSEPHGGWRSKQRCGLRLKDTPEWALFYCAFKDAEAKSSNNS